MASFEDILNTTPDTNYEKDLSLSQRLEKAVGSIEWNAGPVFNTTDAMKASRNPVNRVYDTEDLQKLTSDAGTIAWDTFRKGVLDLASLPDKAEMALGNTLAGLTGDRVGTEMRDRAYDNLMKTMEESRFIDSNYGDAETWTARFTGGAMSMGEMLAIGALTGPVGLGAFVGTTSLSDGALNDMANYYEEHGNLDGYETDPVNLAMDYGNAIFQVGSEMLLGTGRLLNGRVLKHGSAIGATVKETVNNFIQEFSQGLAADATEVLKSNEDINTLLENAGGYVKDGIVGGVLGGVTGGTFYRVNKGRGKGSIKEVLRKLYPQKNEKELDDGAEEIWAKTEEKGLKTFVPEIVAHTEAVNDKGKIRENIRQKVAMMYEDADMSEKEKAKAIEATTTLELENILYDSIERKVPLTAHPLLQGEVNELGWFRTGIPEHRRAEIDALNKELVDLKAQQKELMSAQEKDYNKLEEIETKIEQFRKNLPEKLGDLVVSDRQQVNDMLRVQRNRVAESMKKRQVLQSIKERARRASEKQDKADAALAEKMATGAEKAREQRVKKETAEQTKEAKVRTLTEQREIASAIKSVKVAVKERKQAQNRELRYAIEQATDESLRNVLKNRNWNAYTVDNMKRRQLVAEVKQIPNLSMLELVPMSRRDISYQQEIAESKQEKAKTAKGFFHRKINRDFANESGILQAWGYSKDDPAINLVFVKDGGLADWDEIVMELQDNGYLPQSYARTYEETDALVDQAKDILLNNKELTESMGDMTQSQVDYTADRGEELLLDAGYTPEQIQAMSFQEMSDILSKLYAEDVAQQELAGGQLADLPDIEYQSDRDVPKVELPKNPNDSVEFEYHNQTYKITRSPDGYLLEVGLDGNLFSAIVVKDNGMVEYTNTLIDMRHKGWAVEVVEMAEYLFGDLTITISNRNADAEKLWFGLGYKKEIAYRTYVKEPKAQLQSKVTGKGKDTFRGVFVPEYRFIAKTGNLDASTLAHELAHDWGQENFRWARSGKASEEFMRAWGAVEKAIGITDKDIYFTYDASEKFARAYEGWLLERKDWADILHINTDEEKKAVEEAMEDYRKELVDIYESLTNPYFTMAWGKTGELKPELKEWFERSTKYDELDNKVARGEITEEQASEQKLQDMLESATESTIDGIPVKDKNAIQAIEDLDKLREQEKRFETEGGNTNRIQRRLNAIALAKDMVANNEALNKYNTHRDMLAVAEAADIFVNTRLNDALAIINGKMPEQDGLYASDLYTALERKAKAENDFELVEELRNSLVAKQLAKELGQRVAGFRNYTASGDVDIMSTLKSLDKLYDKAYNEKEREQLEEDVKAYFESVAVADSQLDLDGFFNELECK